MTQLDLFAAPEPEYLINPKKCGTCVFMNTYLPGCSERGLGRCVNKTGKAYYLLPENTRPNVFHDGRVEYPRGGSWAYVAKDSAACDKHKSKKE